MSFEKGACKNFCTLEALALLILLIVCVPFVNFAGANPFSQSAYSGEMTRPADATSPTVKILSPTNNSVVHQNSIMLKLDAVVGQAPMSFPSYVFHGLDLESVYFNIDWLESAIIVNGSSTFSYLYNSSGTSENFYDNFNPRTAGSYNCNLKLDGIPEGKHIVTVNATERGYYYFVEGGVSFHHYGYSISTIASVNFTVDTVPIVSFLSFKNSTIDVSDIPLNFTVNQNVSKITYCLDGQANVTISGNATLTDVSNGHHEIMLYATDDYGNTGASKLAAFSVLTPEPTLKPEPFPLGIFLVPAAIVTLAGIGLIVYRKNKR